MAQRHGVMGNLQPLGDLCRRRASVSLHPECHHARKIFHLRRRQSVLRVRGQAGIHHRFDRGVAFQKLPQRHRALLVSAHPQRQCRGSACDQPRIERRHHPAMMHIRLDGQAADQLRRAADTAAHRIAMPADIFRQRVHHQIGPERQRLGPDGRGKGIIHRDQRPAFMRNAGNLGNISQADQRIAGCVDENQLGFGAHRRRHILGTGGVHPANRHPKPRQGIAPQLCNTSIANIGQDHMIPV